MARVAGLRVAAQGALQVVLVAANSVTFAGYHETGDPWRLAASGVLGFLISYVWWTNARQAGRLDVPHARIWYAGGAAIGTMAGAALALAVLG